MLEKIKRFFSSGRNHENVGRVFASPYFKKIIKVTAYKSDMNWKFEFVPEEYEDSTLKDGPQRKEFKAGTRLSYFVENKLEQEG